VVEAQLTDSIAREYEIAEHAAHESSLRATAAVERITTSQHIPCPSDEAVVRAEVVSVDFTIRDVASALPLSEIVGMLDSDSLPEQPILGEELETLRPPASVYSQETMVLVEADWTAELYDKNPIELFEDFSEELHNFVELAIIMDSTTEISPAFIFQEAGEEIVELSVVTPVIAVVAERLRQLEPNEKEIAALRISDIVGSLHDLRQLEMSGAAPEAVATMEAQLSEMSILLFEMIGVVDYDEHDIKCFIQILQNPKFHPGQATEFTGDIEFMGTREIGRRQPRAINGLVGVLGRIRQELGIVAMLSARVTASFASYELRAQGLGTK
jgi:hypothetical protein